MSSSLSCKRSPSYHGAWIKDFIILNLILFSWLVSMRGGKIEEGEVCLVIQLFRMQIIKSCRCGDQYGAKSYVFTSNLKDKLVVLVEGMANDYVILLRKKLHFLVFPKTATFFITPVTSSLLPLLMFLPAVHPLPCAVSCLLSVDICN